MSRIKLILLAFLLGSFANAEPRFDPRKEASEEDWRYFIQASEKQREEIWHHFSKAGGKKMAFNDWAWTWRMGWLRVCEESKSSLCDQIVEWGLLDKAILIRSKAVDVCGERYRGTQNAQMVKKLADLFRKESQTSSGRMLLIEQHILLALKNIGGKKAYATGSALAKKNSAHKAYWQKLTE